MEEEDKKGLLALVCLFGLVVMISVAIVLANDLFRRVSSLEEKIRRIEGIERQNQGKYRE